MKAKPSFEKVALETPSSSSTKERSVQDGPYLGIFMREVTKAVKLGLH